MQPSDGFCSHEQDVYLQCHHESSSSKLTQWLLIIKLVFTALFQALVVSNKCAAKQTDNKSVDKMLISSNPAATF
jgi:hypothetical protein